MMTGSAPGVVPPPGTEAPRRWRPRLRYELLGCGVHGHELLGTDAARLRPEDALFAFEARGVRWYRCLRCDPWLPLPAPAAPTRPVSPSRGEVAVPLRGRPLRDRFVLRLIAADRIVHVLALTALAVAIRAFARHQAGLDANYTRILKQLQGAVGGPLSDTRDAGLLRDLNRLFTLSQRQALPLRSVAAGLWHVNGVEAVGLWGSRRWAEYLTLIEVVVLLPISVHELTIRVSPLKVIALILNLVNIAYLIWAHRLVGVRGGGKADQAERDRDTGWAALERTAVPPAASSGD